MLHIYMTVLIKLTAVELGISEEADVMTTIRWLNIIACSDSQSSLPGYQYCRENRRWYIFTL